MTHPILPPESAPKQSADIIKQKQFQFNNNLDDAEIGHDEKTPQPAQTGPDRHTLPLVQTDAQANLMLDPEAEQIGTAHSLLDQMAESEEEEEEAAVAELAFGEEDDVALDKSTHERRISIEQDEPDSLLNDQDPVPPKGN